MIRKRLSRVVAATLFALGATLLARQDGAVIPSGGASNADWPVYRGDPKGNQYSALAHIHAANVHRLQPAWEYKTGDANQRIADDAVDQIDLERVATQRIDSFSARGRVACGVSTSPWRVQIWPPTSPSMAPLSASTPIMPCSSRP